MLDSPTRLLSPLSATIASLFVAGTAHSQQPTLLLELNGPAGSDFGTSAALTPDIDGDGFPEVAVGSRKSNSGRGRLAIIGSSSGSDLAEIEGPNPNAGLGWSIDRGDWDGDGDQELLIGCNWRGWPSNGNCTVYVVDYPSLQVLWSQSGSGEAFFGLGAAFLPDLDGDGLGELIVPTANSNCAGTDSGSIAVYDTAGTQRWNVCAYGSWDYWGSNKMYAFSDSNDDGVNDILAPAPETCSCNPGPGYIRALDAVTGTTLWTHYGAGFPSRIEAITDGGDWNGDGVSDALARHGYSNNDALTSCRVVDSTTGDLLHEIATPNAGYAGYIPVPDRDGDGLPDIVGARTDGVTTSLVLWGSSGGEQEFAIPAAAGQPVEFLDGRQDYNGDGFGDAIVGIGGADTVLIFDLAGLFDCNGNGVVDSVEISTGASYDCNGNGIPDECDVASGVLADCNLNGIADCNEFAMGSASDCNANGIPDTCDIDGDPSLDLDGNGILDSCEATQVVWTQSPINGRYYTSLPPMTWAEAEAIAVSYGGHLATVRSQEENDWVAAFYGLDQAWIGLNDLATEGSFGWSSGESLLFTNWAPGSPGGFAPDQDFVAISGLDGNWNDWFAGTLYPGIVEVGGADCDDDTRPDDYEIATAPENDWNGDGILDVCVPPNYCEGAPNSATPDGGVMSISGSPLISDNDVELRATGLPGSQWSFFIMSRTQASVPGFGGSQGVLCLGAPQYRFNRSALGEIAQTTPLGVRSLALDLTNLPQGVVMLPGETWNFQLWYRDQNPGQTSNTTDGLEVLFR